MRQVRQTQKRKIREAVEPLNQLKKTQQHKRTLLSRLLIVVRLGTENRPRQKKRPAKKLLEARKIAAKWMDSKRQLASMRKRKPVLKVNRLRAKRPLQRSSRRKEMLVQRQAPRRGTCLLPQRKTIRMLRTKSQIPLLTRQQEVIRMAALLGKVVTRHHRSRKRSLEQAKRVKRVKKGNSLKMKV